MKKFIQSNQLLFGEVYANISTNLSQLQQHKEASQFARKSHEIFKQTLDRVIAKSISKENSLEEKSQKAKHSSTQVEEVKDQAYLQVLVMDSYYQYGQCILRLNQHKEALKIFSEGFHESNAILGRGHPSTLKLREKVQLLSRYKSQGTTQYAMRDKNLILPGLSPISMGPVMNMELKPVKSPPLSRQSSIKQRSPQPSPEMSLISEHGIKKQHMLLRQKKSDAQVRTQEKG